ncbi:MAG: class I SAM-dependent rRNA methyltransferase [Deltaproteobacteria bacterium]|nr:class I SAM-dependent rRNA methyltransferase [Deltaproteobacteria bacterium]
MKKVTVKPNRDYPVRRGHFWLFSGALNRDYSEIGEGELVQVLASDGKPLGVGHWGKSSIAVKMLQFGEKELSNDFWALRISAAKRVREELGLLSDPSTDSYRLVNGEGDSLPGLIVDIYGSNAVLQYHSAGMAMHEEQIAAALESVYAGKITSAFRLSEIKHSTLGGSGYIFGNAELPYTICESGHRFLVDWQSGQKTGFFLDQRVNRGLLAGVSAGRTVLNAFCYSGAFSVYALAAGAKRVVSLDSSKQAAGLAVRNVELNGLAAAHEMVVSDYQSYIASASEPFDFIILDPPAFAKNRRSITSGKEGYVKINRAAMEKIAGPGLLGTFSCSQLVSRDEFLECLQEAAFLARRSLRRVAEMHQAPCHPVHLQHPEGEYLKGFLLWVD